MPAGILNQRFQWELSKSIIKLLHHKPMVPAESSLRITWVII
jgi:hypothetical protein